MARGRSCKNPPYRWMTEAKWNTLGETITVKQALDKWWNSVRIRKKEGGYILIYKCCNGEYEVSEFENTPGFGDMPENKILELKITLDDEYDEDWDGYPVVYANFAGVN